MLFFNPSAPFPESSPAAYIILPSEFHAVRRVLRETFPPPSPNKVPDIAPDLLTPV